MSGNRKPETRNFFLSFPSKPLLLQPNKNYLLITKSGK
jgi:hypothetical protein